LDELLSPHIVFIHEEQDHEADKENHRENCYQ
jgi:hypothetical protein